MARLTFWLFRLVEEILARFSLEQLRLSEEQQKIIEAQGAPNFKSSFSVFSQGAEDGLSLQILERLSLDAGVFLEIGVGNGLENNTNVLLSQGWKGCWLSDQRLAISRDRTNSSLVKFKKISVSTENVGTLVESYLRQIDSPDIDFLSIDIDSYDALIFEAILSRGLRPKIIVLEYNPHLGSRVDFSAEYSNRSWNMTNYYGSSIGYLVALAREFGYVLVGATHTFSANCFFVPRTLAEQANLEILSPDELPFYGLFRKSNFLHPPDPRIVSQLSGGGYSMLHVEGD